MTNNNGLHNLAQSSNVHHGFRAVTNVGDRRLVPPPPGLEKAPLSVYSLPGVNMPAMLPSTHEMLEEAQVEVPRPHSTGSSRPRENDIQGEAQKRRKEQSTVSHAMAALSNYEYSDDE